VLTLAVVEVACDLVVECGGDNDLEKRVCRRRGARLVDRVDLREYEDPSEDEDEDVSLGGGVCGEDLSVVLSGIGVDVVNVCVVVFREASV